MLFLESHLLKYAWYYYYFLGTAITYSSGRALLIQFIHYNCILGINLPVFHLLLPTHLLYLP
jgi:hypothetical protein